MKQQVFHGNNLELLKQYPDNYFDAIVTDPPYGLGKEPNAEEMLQAWITSGYLEVKGSGFMGKEWDAFVPQPIFWKEVFRTLKHGGHVVSFFGTRTYDWGVMAMRLAGFEIRDCIQWIYGSGFPKSHNISKAIDKSFGAEREVISSRELQGTAKTLKGNNYNGDKNVEKTDVYNITAPSTEQAKQWDGWGTALKPAHEDLVLARKPFQFSSDFVYLYENIVYNLKLKICQSKLFAKDVKEIFTLSQKDSKKVELDFAQWSVGKPFNTKEDLLVVMDMLQLEMKEGNTTLNIVWLWLNTLVELWNVANTYTIETESSTITELRILKSLEWESIFQNITLLKDNKTNGLIANVLTAESLFSVLNLKLNDILTHFAKENVTSKESEKTFVPNSEQIVLARKPLEKGLSIAENVMKWGTGGINIDGCRVDLSFGDDSRLGGNGSWKTDKTAKNVYEGGYEGKDIQSSNLGRFPANLILTHHPECECVGTKKVKSNGNFPSQQNTSSMYMTSKGKSLNPENDYSDENGQETIEDWTCHEDCPIRIIDEQSGVTKGENKLPYNYESNEYKVKGFISNIKPQSPSNYNDKGGASRFFYVAKASKSERNKGLSNFEEKRPDDRDVKGMGSFEEKGVQPQKNFHPTVKPVALMQYLVRMITPPNGIVLDPFNGSGTTGIACKLEEFEYVGMELDAEYCKIAQARIDNFVPSDLDYSHEVKQQNEEEQTDDDKKYQLSLF
jgi:DNA modification methylase